MRGPCSAIRLSRAYWLTLALFLALQIASWLPKLAVAAHLCVAATFLRRCWRIVFAVSVSGLCVLGNISHF